MKTLQQTLGISLLLITLLSTGNVLGQKRNTSGNRTLKTEHTYSNHNRHGDRYKTQPIRRNPSYRYPRHRRVVSVLPRHHVSVVYRGLPYFYYSGIYYTMYGNEYIVVMPPRGFRVTVLPVGHVRIVVGPSVYFYHSGVYYIESTSPSADNEGKYEVTQPPVGTILNTIDKDAEEVIIDGHLFYEYNNVLYKKNTNLEENTTYEVVYCKSENDSY